MQNKKDPQRLCYAKLEVLYAKKNKHHRIFTQTSQKQQANHFCTPVKTKGKGKQYPKDTEK